MNFPHPGYAPLRPLLAQLPQERFPDSDDLNRLADSCGAPVRFAPPAGIRSALQYERAIDGTGVVPTRRENWHDLFNALCWLRFPQTKQALNRVHTAHAGAAGGGRGVARDAATLLDESGAIVLVADACWADRLRCRQWRELFWLERDRYADEVRVIVVGHALYDKLRSPYKELTAKAMVMEVTPGLLHGDPEGPLRAADEAAAARWCDATPVRLHPLPLLGIPGWDTGNAESAYYDDPGVFRPMRAADRPALL
jgi:hypothetical protein